MSRLGTNHTYIPGKNDYIVCYFIHLTEVLHHSNYFDLTKLLSKDKNSEKNVHENIMTTLKTV